VDNGTEFHEYAALEQATAVRFYFATPHHAWERGTNENTTACSANTCPSARAWPTSRSTIAIGSLRN